MSAPAEFKEHFETLNLDQATLQLGHGETIVPPDLQNPQESMDAVRTLPRLGTGDAPGMPADLRLLGTLGEGGMGLVRLAKQVALDRDVAVKTLRSHSNETAPKLLQEAYVTGKLEHPNIVPIYTLGRDQNDAPLIVMKRIEGVSWLDVLRNPDVMPELQIDLLWHLETLMQLCNAIRYAHRHDVIHRDIKPENVMIGEFGEVYLLDWGIAISIADDPSVHPALPHRSTVKGMAGTPAYMAPEMTGDSAVDQDARTDIYLLGSLLHEIIAGKPRHDGEKLFDVLRSAFENKPYDYPKSVPTELASIAARATATDKEDRFQTVEAFRAAIVDFIDHRGSLALIEEAEQLLDELESTTDVEGREFELHDKFIEVRFACDQALRAWPENEHGVEVRQRYLAARFAHSVELKDTIQARGMLEQLEEAGIATEEQRLQFDDLLAATESEREELAGLRELARDLDLRRGRFSRSMAMALMGVLWAADTLRSWWVIVSDPTYDLTNGYIEGTGRVLAIGIIALVLFRKALFKNSANRRLAWVLISVLMAIGVFRVSFAFSPENVSLARALEVGAYGMAGMAGGLLSDDRRILALGCLYFPVALATAYYGPSATYLVAIAHLFVFGGAAYFWTPKQFAKRPTI